MLSNSIRNCPVCREEGYNPFFELSHVPVQDGVLWNSRDEAIHAPTGNIQLAFCRSCGFIGNVLFDPKKIRYDHEYSFSLHFSPTYQEYINNLAYTLVEDYQLKNKTVLEIGCGQGDFLRLISKLGNNRCIGIDPSIASREEKVGQSIVTYIQDVYSERFANLEVDFVCCRQVLDQIHQPKGFVETVRNNLNHLPNTVAYFEVPNAANIFEELLIRNIIYEKSTWFTLYSISRLFELSGFKVLSAEPCFEAGQYIGIEARINPIDDARQNNRFSVDSSFELSIAGFRNNYQQKINSWDNQLRAIQNSGKRAIAWGAGSGAISLCSLLNIKEEIPYVIDINPKRQGKFLPVTGQQVVPPEFLLEYKADIVVITNSTYEHEIKRHITDLEIECDYWVI